MVFPIVEPEDGNYRTGSNQNPNSIINLDPNASDPDLIQENTDYLSKSLLLLARQCSEKGDVRLKYLFPGSGELLFHNPQPPQAPPPNHPVDERT